MRDAAILMPSLFDHLVSEREQLVGYIDAERLGGLEIDHQLECGRLGYRIHPVKAALRIWGRG